MVSSHMTSKLGFPVAHAPPHLSPDFSVRQKTPGLNLRLGGAGGPQAGDMCVHAPSRVSVNVWPFSFCRSGCSPLRDWGAEETAQSRKERDDSILRGARPCASSPAAAPAPGRQIASRLGV